MIRKACFVTGAILIAANCFAQKRVTTFAPKLRHASDAIKITPTPDGGLLVYSYVDYINGEPSGLLSKLDAYGKPWPGFNRIKGKGFIQKAVVTPSGKIIVRGDFLSIAGAPAPGLTQLNADGTVDATFRPNVDAYDFVVQSDGKVVVSILGIGLRRLKPDGSPDASYNGSNNGNYFFLYPGTGNKVYASTGFSIDRFLVSGAADPTFSQVVTDNSVYAATEDSNGNLLIGGGFLSVNGTPQTRLARITPQGTLDATFNAGVTSGAVSAILGKGNHLIVAGMFLQINGSTTGLVDLMPTGQLYYDYGLVNTNSLLDLSMVNDKVTLAGAFTQVAGEPRVGLAQFDDDNSLDDDFAPDVTFGMGWSYLTPPVVDSSHRLIVIGGVQPSSRFLGAYDNGEVLNRQLIRYTTSGVVDESWTPSEANISDIEAAAIQADDKILLGGYFFGASKRLIRLMPDGSIDQDFDVNFDLSGNVFRILVKGNDIYVSGTFNEVNGQATHSLVKLNSDGEVTQTFTALPQNTYVHRFSVQSDGKVVVAHSIPGYTLARLNPDGTLDGSFAQSTIDFQPGAIETDSQGRIYVVGPFSTFNGGNKKHLVRLLSNGQIDNSFFTGTGFDGYPLTMTLLPNGNLMVGGYINAYQGNPTPGVAVIRPDGAWVSTATYGFEWGSSVWSFAQTPGSVYATGRFILEGFEDVIGAAKFSFPPAKPANLTASVSSLGVATLQWTDASDNEVAFDIEQGNATSGVTTHFNEPQNSTSHQENIPPWTAITFKVSAVGEEVPSDPIGPVSVYWDPTPNAPTDLTGTTQLRSVSLTWTDNASNETGFIIERKVTGSTGDFMVVGESSTASYSEDGLSFSTTYSYRVAAKNDYATSAYSEVFHLTTFSTPAPPTGLSLTNQGSAIKLTWTDNSDNEAGYIIERKVSPGQFVLLHTIDEADVETYSDSDLVLPAEISYRVAAFNAAGTSTYSNTAVFTDNAITGLEYTSRQMVYPNPATTVVHIQFDSPARTEVAVYNSVGACVQNVVKVDGQVTLDVAVDQLPPGVYVVLPERTRTPIKFIKN